MVNEDAEGINLLQMSAWQCLVFLIIHAATVIAECAHLERLEFRLSFSSF